MRTTLLKVTAVLALASVFAMAQQGNPPDPGKMAQRHLDFLSKAAVADHPTATAGEHDLQRSGKQRQSNPRSNADGA